MSMGGHHSIQEVSRLSGIPKELLRMWERRYGYPRPDRDAKGNRLYSGTDLSKLILVRQLMDQGRRPGKLIHLEREQLEDLLQHRPADFSEETLLDLLAQNNPPGLRQWLQEQLQSRGLRGFVYHCMVPAIGSIGAAWAAGRLPIHAEHLFTELLESLLRQALAEQYRQGGSPKVMLATLPGEQHSLGLLMAEALLQLGGAEVISFGTQMPLRTICDAAGEHQVDIIGLSFSSSFPLEEALAMLTGLRQMIDPQMRIWAGGAAFLGQPPMPEGLCCLPRLEDLERALSDWRAADVDVGMLTAKIAQ